MPANIRLEKELELPEAMTERELIEHINELGNKNKIFTLYWNGMVRYLVSAVIQRNVLENPGWYTSYTPYQAEISQGRLEALFNFQTVISELTSLPSTNSSLLDEATSVEERQLMMLNARSRKRKDAVKLFVADDVYLSTRRVIETRAIPWGVEVVVGKADEFDFSAEFYMASFYNTPTTTEKPKDYREFVQKAKDADIQVAVATDLLRSYCSRLLANGAPTLHSAHHNGSEFLCISVVLLQVISRPQTPTSARFLVVSSGCPKTPMESQPTA